MLKKLTIIYELYIIFFFKFIFFLFIKYNIHIYIEIKYN